MDKSIVTSFMIIAAVVCAALVFKAVYPAVVKGSAAMTSVENRMTDRLKGHIDIIHATGECDAGTCDVSIWVKNTGATRIVPLESLDVFVGPEGGFQRLPYESYAGGTIPVWSGAVEDHAGGDWDPTTTLKITARFASVDPGPFIAKVVIPSGYGDTLYFGL